MKILDLSKKRKINELQGLDTEMSQKLLVLEKSWVKLLTHKTKLKVLIAATPNDLEIEYEGFYKSIEDLIGINRLNGICRMGTPNFYCDNNNKHCCAIEYDVWDLDDKSSINDYIRLVEQHDTLEEELRKIDEQLNSLRK